MEDKAHEQDDHPKWIKPTFIFATAVLIGAFAVYGFGKKCSDGDACHINEPDFTSLHSSSLPTTPQTPATVDNIRSIDRLVRGFKD